MSDFTLSRGRRDVIKEINWDTISASGSDDTEVDDFGDYAVVDNFLQKPDDFWNAIDLCPAGYEAKVIEAAQKEGKGTNEPTWPGVKQLISTHYLRGILFDCYKLFIECEFIPHDLDVNLENPSFAFELPTYSLTYAELVTPDMFCNKNANMPAPGRFDYNAVLFRDGNPNHGISFYDYVHAGEHYSDLQDLMEINDENLQKEIGEGLNKTMIEEEIVKYENFTGNESFLKSRFVEAKANRLVLFKGSKWHTYDYNNEGDFHTLTCSINNPPKPKENEGNEFENPVEEDPLYV